MRPLFSLLASTLLGVSSTDDTDSEDCFRFDLVGRVDVGLDGVSSVNKDRLEDFVFEISVSVSDEIRLERRTGTVDDDSDDDFLVRLEIGITSSEDFSLNRSSTEDASLSSSLDDCDIWSSNVLVEIFLGDFTGDRRPGAGLSIFVNCLASKS